MYHSTPRGKSIAKVRGFTLVEIIAAIGIFGVVSFLITSGLLSLMGYRDDITMRQALFDELRLTAEQLEREIITGYFFYTPGALPGEPSWCMTGGSDTYPCIEFTVRTRDDSAPHRVSYRFQNGVLYKGEQRPYGDCENIPLIDKCYLPVTSPDTRITYAGFRIKNMTDSTKPLITFTVQGEVDVNGTPRTMNYSRTIGSRVIQDPDVIALDDNQAPTIEWVRLESASQGWSTTLVDTYTMSATLYNSVKGDLKLVIKASDNALGGVLTIGYSNLLNGDRQTKTYVAPNVSANPSAWTTPNPIDLMGGFENTITVDVTDLYGNMTTNTYRIQVEGTPEPPPQITNLEFEQSCLTDTDGTPDRVKFHLGNNGNAFLNKAYTCKTNPGNTCNPLASSAARGPSSNQDYYWEEEPGAGYVHCATLCSVIESPTNPGTYIQSPNCTIKCLNSGNTAVQYDSCDGSGGTWNFSINPDPLKITVTAGSGSNDMFFTLSGTNKPTSLNGNIVSISGVSSTALSEIKSKSSFQLSSTQKKLHLVLVGIATGSHTVKIRLEDKTNTNNYVTKSMTINVEGSSAGQ